MVTLTGQDLTDDENAGKMESNSIGMDAIKSL